MEYPSQKEPTVEVPPLDHGDLREKGLLQLRSLDSSLSSLQKIDGLYRTDSGITRENEVFLFSFSPHQLTIPNYTCRVGP